MIALDEISIDWHEPTFIRETDNYLIIESYTD